MTMEPKTVTHPRRTLMPVVHKVAEVLDNAEGVVDFFLGGSWIRGRQECADLDFAVCVEAEPAEAMWDRTRELHNAEQPLKGCKNLQGTIQIDGVQVDLWTATPIGWGPLRQYVAGSGKFNIFVRNLARRRGFLLGHRQISLLDDESKSPVPCMTEAELFRMLELPWRTYEDREFV